VIDLYSRTQVGTKVVVLPVNHRQIAMLPAASGSANNLR
jgi:hypothetical protein